MTPADLHTVFCRESGLSIALKRGLADTELEFLWHLWIQAGFVEDDLLAVIRYIKRNQKPKGLYPRETLNPGTMLQVGRFKVLLSFARDDERNRRRPLSNRESILKATGRPVEAPATVTTPRVILGDKEADWIARMREAAK